MQYLKGRLLPYQLNTINHRKTVSRHSDMQHLKRHQTEAGRILGLRPVNTTMHHLYLRHINTSNNKNRQCALLNKPLSNRHLSDHNQQGNRATRSNSNNSNRRKHLRCRSRNNKLHRHKTLRLVLLPDPGKDPDSQSPMPKLLAS